jgi:hypothetical protein
MLALAPDTKPRWTAWKNDTRVSVSVPDLYVFANEALLGRRNKRSAELAESDVDLCGPTPKKRSRVLCAKRDVVNAVKAYATTGMTIPEVHKKLEDLLGNKYQDNLAHWNALIDRLAPSEDCEHLDFDNIIAESFVSIPELFPDEALHDSPVRSHSSLKLSDSDDIPYAVQHVADLHHDDITDQPIGIWAIPCTVSFISFVVDQHLITSVL